MKKQSLITFLLVLFMSMIGIKAFAYDIAVKNADGVTIYYSYINDSSLEVKAYNNSYTGNVVIPEEVIVDNKTCKVKRIGDSAFSGCSSLTSVSIPNSVTYIGKWAFSGCSSLTSIIIPNSVSSIEILTFNDCKSLISVTIGNGVTSIDDSAFSGCESLTSIDIPNSVISIGDRAFAGCVSMTSVTIPNSVTSIGMGTFVNCSGLTSFTIPNSVTSIGHSAFYGCSGLTSVTIPESVTSIDYDAFTGCSSLNAVHISDLEAWCKIIFTYDDSNPLNNSSRLFLNGVEIRDLLIPNSVTSIGNYAFQGCKSIESLTIPKSVKNIGLQAFRDCSNLSSIVVEKGNMTYDSRDNSNAIIATSSDELIYGCKNTVIPNSVTSIGSSAFSGCTGLTSVIIPNSVTSIGGSAFFNCSNLTSITIPNNMSSIYMSAFEGCSSLTSITLPNSIKVISSATFQNCASLISITIPDGVTTIGDAAFKGCSNLTSATIPSSVTSIGRSAFYNCSSLTSINIPNSVTSIGNGAFSYCSGVTSITIPSSVKSIGKRAFYIAGLSTIVSEVEKPFEIYGMSSSDMTFTENTFHNGILYVPVGTKDKYRTIYGWRDFVHIATIGSTPDDDWPLNGTCGENVNFSYNKNTHTLTISGRGSMAKYNTSNNKAPWLIYANDIQNIEIESGITYIGDFAFYECSNVRTLSIPTTVIFIGISAFKDCASLTSLTLSEGLETIKDSAFEGCAGLMTLTLPSTLYSILSNAFKSCYSLNSIYSYAEEPPGTDETAFDETPTESAIFYVPAVSVETYKASWPWSKFKSIVAIGSTPDDGSTISGSCGETVSYSYDKATHTLAISGNGAMADYDFGKNEASWFSYADEIQKIEIESGITSIGHFTFYKCSGITSLSIPATVGYIGSSAFEDCTGLTSLSLNEGLLYFGGSAFEGCSGLQTISIPSTVNTISINAFKNCKGITDVYCYAENVPDTHFDAFDGTPTEKSILHVPANSAETYRTSWPWSDFKEIEAIEEETPDGIINVKQSDDCNGGYYDLTGRRFLHPQKGLYIRNGKKVVVK